MTSTYFTRSIGQQLAAYGRRPGTVVADLILGGLYVLIRLARPVLSRLPPPNALDFDWLRESTAYEHFGWVEGFTKELYEAMQLTYHPFLGWRIRDYAGQYINNKDGCRKSYQSITQTDHKLRVYALGASTTWGWGVRDEHTIPSCLVKRAEQDGIELEMSNYSEMGYVFWQNITHLAQLCAAGEPPDAVYFYSGLPDAITKIKNPTAESAHFFYRNWRPRIEDWHSFSIIQQWFAEHGPGPGVLRRGWHKLRRTQTTPVIPAADPTRIRQIAREIVLTYSQHVAFVQQLAASYGFKVWFFWEPLLYLKKKPSADERRLIEERRFIGAYSDLLTQVYSAATEEIRAQNLAIDLSEVFDGEKRTMHIDFYHVSEAGNQIVADAIYRQLKPALLELQHAKCAPVTNEVAGHTQRMHA